ncbi:MAG: hypothetical protein NW214_03375 [Pseudanabaenaceae cyanobacterium bins.39]|nr:hypothetical protein [Pseudanabaenaceae cyanobacterium bins.39]
MAIISSKNILNNIFKPQKYLQYLQTVLLSVVLVVCTLLIAPPAWATVQIKLSDLTYAPCQGDVGKNMVLGGGVMSANCYEIKGVANNVSGKPVYNADIFGRIYDANGNDAMPERTRLGAVDEIPVGKSEFSLIVAIPADQPEPLELKQFKASGFAGKVRR